MHQPSRRSEPYEGGGARTCSWLKLIQLERLRKGPGVRLRTTITGATPSRIRCKPLQQLPEPPTSQGGQSTTRGGGARPRVPGASSYTGDDGARDEELRAGGAQEQLRSSTTAPKVRTATLFGRALCAPGIFTSSSKPQEARNFIGCRRGRGLQGLRDTKPAEPHRGVGR